MQYPIQYFRVINCTSRLKPVIVPSCYNDACNINIFQPGFISDKKLKQSCTLNIDLPPRLTLDRKSWKVTYTVDKAVIELMIEKKIDKIHCVTTGMNILYSRNKNVDDARKELLALNMNIDDEFKDPL